jgi:UDP-glucose 4-epimerase
VLVTGALGVNGVWTIRSLLDLGADVLATGRTANFELAPELEGSVAFRALDVTSPKDVHDVVDGYRPDVIAHLAALLPGAAQADPRRGFEVNLMGTANVLAAAQESGVRRVVYTSTKGVYGAVTGRHGHPAYEPMPENGEVHPVLIYDWSKYAGEGLGENHARNGDFEFASLRFASIYAPGKLKRHGPLSLASRMIEEPAAGKPFRLAQGGDQLDDYIYVRDAGEAVALLALHPEPLRHAVYNVGTGRAVSLHELAGAVRRHVPGADIEIGAGFDPLGLGIPYHLALDGTRMADEFGWRPRYDFDTGVADYLDVLRQLDAPREVAAR